MKGKALFQWLSVTLALAAGPWANAQTAFPYQGRLVDECCPATGYYDLTFRVFDNAGPGVGGVLGIPMTLTRVPVTNGLFAVSLDFGSAPFNGARRWLQVEARTNNVAAPYVTLTPRAELAPTPYAIYASRAGTVASGGVTTNGLATPIPPTANQILSFNGSSMQWISAPSGSDVFSLNGSSAYYSGGNVGIGTSSPQTPLDIRSPDAEEQGIHISRPEKTTEIYLHIADNDYGFFNLGGGTILRGSTGNGIGSSFGGKVGIGMTSSTAQLEVAPGSGVNGVVGRTTNAGFYGVVGQANSAGWGGLFQFGNDGNNAAYLGGNGYAAAFYGKVGIGTDIPSARLDVAAAPSVNGIIARATSSGTYGVVGQGNSAGWGGLFQFGNDGNNAAYLGGNGQAATFYGAITVNGNVGIGTGSPAFMLHVNGSAGKPGGGSWSVASDERLKKNIHSLTGALDKLLALRGVNFEYNEPEKIGELSGERIGLVAQEVEEVFPDWVETGSDGFKRVTVRGLEALVVEALRQLRAEKDGEIVQLKKSIAELKTLVSQHNGGGQ